ncbi:MAG: helix-turn-helix transcriptional regulator [Nocardioides sp.]
MPSCRLLPAAVEILVAVEALDEAQEAGIRLERLAVQVGTPALAAAASLTSGRVTLATGDAGGALPYLRKAHQQWGRIGAPYEVARTRVLVGRAVAALGDLESARRELTAAAESLAALGAAPEADEAARLGSPGRLPGGLTAREVEVLRLVAAGRSNAQIAAELVLSDKTVARHLSNIFGKLEVGSRTAAAAFAFAHGLA